MVFVLQNKLTKVLIAYMVPCTRTEFINNYRRIPTKPLLEETMVLLNFNKHHLLVDIPQRATIYVNTYKRDIPILLQKVVINMMQLSDTQKYY